MTGSVAPFPMASATPGGSVRAAGIRGLDTAGVLRAAAERRCQADRAEADLLVLAVHLVDLHPVTAEVLEATWRPVEVPEDGAGAAAGAGVGAGLLAGVGAPAVAEVAVVELGAVLGVGYRSALSLVADAVELCFRLPRLWELVQSGRLQSWRARQVAAATTGLSRAAVEFVDRHAAVLGVRGRVPDPARLRDLVHEALLQFDPEVAEGREQAALMARDVRFAQVVSTGCTQLVASLDTVDALDLDATVGDLAGVLGRWGDTDPVGVRRAHALGMLAHPQRVLDLFGDPHTPHTPQTTGDPDAPSDPDTAGEPGTSGGPHTGGDDPVGSAGATTVGLSGVLRQPGWSRSTATLYVHLSLADLADLAGMTSLTSVTSLSGLAVGSSAGAPLGAPPGAPSGAAVVEGLGPMTGRLVGNWLRRVDRVTVRPVLHANTAGGPGPGTAGAAEAGAVEVFGAVERHDPPEWMRETVRLRDGHCVFPGCRIDARRCDLDHVVAYRDPDQGGPPGQTSVANLACLCRRHHRLKTFTAWDYQRLPDGTYRWSSTHRLGFLTHPTPTTAPRSR